LVPHTEDIIQKLLTEISPNNKLWLNLITETVTNPTTDRSVKRENDENVPILVATLCEVRPALTVSTFDMQTQTEEIVPMNNYKLSLVGIPGTNNRVFMLKSASTLNYAVLQQMLLYQRQPRKIKSDRPNKVEAVNVTFNETLVIWNPDFDEKLETNLKWLRRL